MPGVSGNRSAWYLISMTAWLCVLPSVEGQEPQALNPFRSRDETPHPREDAQLGYLELSDGRVRLGELYLTRETRLKIFDEARKRHREIPWNLIQRIDCTVLKEWEEPEWRFRENANDEKVRTGRSYPVREYTHQITLRNGQKIRGPLSAIVYVQESPDRDPVRYVLHKRDKGEPGTTLKMMVHVRSIQLGEQALKEGKRLEAKKIRQSAGAKRSSARKGHS